MGCLLLGRDRVTAELQKGHPLSTQRSALADNGGITAREAELLTGVSAERLRTWERRHGLAVYEQDGAGRRRIKQSEVAKIVAVKQLIAAGHPVAHAIERVNRLGVPAPDVAALSAMFDGVSQPVVAFTGPLPLRPIWSNSVARGAGAAELRLPSPTEPAFRALQRLLIKPEGGSLQISHRAWSDGVNRCRSVAWSVGHAGGEMPVAVVIGLPDDHPEAVAPVTARADAARDLRAWVAGLRGARLALQRDGGLRALGTALSAFSDAVGADDGFLVLRQQDQLRSCKSIRGKLYRPMVPPTDVSWDRAAGSESGAWLSVKACADLGAAVDAQLRALPLTGDGANLGFAVLAFTERPPIGEEADAVLAGFAGAAAATLRRDRMIATRKRVLTTSNSFGKTRVTGQEPG